MKLEKANQAVSINSTTPAGQLLQVLSKREEESLAKGYQSQDVFSDKLSVVSFFVNKIDFNTAMSEGLQVSALRSQNQKQYVDFMKLLLHDLVNFFKCKRTLEGTYDYEQVISIISKTFWHLRIEEIAYCFNQVKLGKYGKVYDRLTGDVIIDFLTAYDTSLQKLDYISNQNKQLQKQKDHDLIDNTQYNENGKFNSKKFYEDGLKHQQEQQAEEARKKFFQEEEKRIDNERYLEELRKQKQARVSLFNCLPPNEQEAIKRKATHERLVASRAKINKDQIPTDEELKICQQFISNVNMSIYGS